MKPDGMNLIIYKFVVFEPYILGHLGISHELSSTELCKIPVHDSNFPIRF